MALKISQFINSLGFSVCHQIPERTLFFGKILMPVCSRCSGIYIGFLISIIFLFLTFRKKESDLPPVYIMILSIMFILSAIVDGALSYLGVYETNNILRLITGYLFGSGIAIIIYPIFVYQYYKVSRWERIFYHFKYFIYFMAVSLSIMIIMLLQPAIFGTFFYYLNGIAVIFTFYFTNLTLFLLIPSFSQKAQKLFSRYLAVPSVIALTAALIELFIMYELHSLII
ncbi:MAG: DUF2085 domain-containing protein [Actinobacteria bacterium]|nr:DUF2085 domain-containing protein [Actinomycetota bacterium]